jgi:hypothetical protein
VRSGGQDLLQAVRVVDGAQIAPNPVSSKPIRLPGWRRAISSPRAATKTPNSARGSMGLRARMPIGTDRPTRTKTSTPNTKVASRGRRGVASALAGACPGAGHFRATALTLRPDRSGNVTASGSRTRHCAWDWRQTRVLTPRTHGRDATHWRVILRPAC